MNTISIKNNKHLNEKYIKPEEAAKLLNVTVTTLINWDREGKIKCIRTKGGHRRFLLSYICKEFGISNNIPNTELQTRRKICYCRVSTSSQKKDLETQVEFFQRNYPNYEIIRDIGSGINFKRKGFNSILDSAIKGNVQEVVVTHQDRLCRFGFELIQRIIEQQSNGKILVLNQEETSPEKELVNDLVSIITVFSSRLYGLRSHSIKKKIKDATTTQNIENSSISN
jgi:excisionase family DNA binding protein